MMRKPLQSGSRSIRHSKITKKLNDQGTSLIELIVALLILVIITVPLLQLFTVAARVNSANDKTINAERVAVNILEVVKSKGLQGKDGIAYKVNQIESAGSGAFYGIVCDGGAVDSSITRSWDKNKKEFVKNGSDTYVYNLNGVTEGTAYDKFNVTITCSAASGNKVAHGIDLAEVNSSSGASTIAFAPETTVFIDPLSSRNFYDEAAIKYFKYANINYVDNYNLRADKQYEEDMRNYREGDPLPSRTPHISYADLSRIVDTIERELIITIADSEDGKSYVVNAEFSYQISDHGYVIDASERLVDSELPAFPGVGFCSNIEKKDLKNICLFYVPFPYLSAAAFDEDKYNSTQVEGSSFMYKTDYMINDTDEHPITIKDNQTISVINNPGTLDEPNLYIIGQGNVTAGSSLSVNYFGGGDVHSNIMLSGVSNYHSGLDGDEIVESDIYKVINVTVTVRDKDNTEVLREVNSTISQN